MQYGLGYMQYGLGYIQYGLGYIQYGLWYIPGKYQNLKFCKMYIHNTV